MKAVILAAKKTESMDPLTSHKPLGMLPVGNIPLVKHTIKRLQECGVDDFFIVTNHLSEIYEEEFEEYTNVNIIQQEETNGTSDALSQVNFIDDTMIVVNGDVYLSERDLNQLANIPETADVGVLGTNSKKPEKFGVLSISGQEITSIREKPEKPENILVNTGAYKLDPEIFAHLEHHKNLVDAVSKMIENTRGEYRLVQDYWIDIGGMDSYLEANRLERETMSGKVSEDAEVHPSATISEGSVIEKGVIVGPNSTVTENSVVKKGSKIGAGSVVKNSLIQPHCVISDSHVESSVLMEGTIMDPYSSSVNSVIGDGTLVKPNVSVKSQITDVDAVLKQK